MLRTTQDITFYVERKPTVHIAALAFRVFDYATVALFLYSGWSAGQVLFG